MRKAWVEPWRLQLLRVELLAQPFEPCRMRHHPRLRRMVDEQGKARITKTAARCVDRQLIGIDKFCLWALLYQSIRRVILIATTSTARVNEHLCLASDHNTTAWRGYDDLVESHCTDAPATFISHICSCSISKGFGLDAEEDSVKER